MTTTKHMIVEAIALMSSGLFAGVAAYVGLIARASWLRAVRLDAPAALSDFRFVFPRVMALQGGLLVVGVGSAIASWLETGAPAFMVCALLLGAVAPLTLVFVTPVYRQLLNRALAEKPPEAERQLIRWAWLHAAQALLGLAAFATLAAALVRG